jgi:hypothetical protein
MTPRRSGAGGSPATTRSRTYRAYEDNLRIALVHCRGITMPWNESSRYASSSDMVQYESVR